MFSQSAASLGTSLYNVSGGIRARYAALIMGAGIVRFETVSYVRRIRAFQSKLEGRKRRWRLCVLKGLPLVHG